MFRFEHIEYLWALLSLPFWEYLSISLNAFVSLALDLLGERGLLDRLGPKLSEKRMRWRYLMLFLGLAFVIVGWANPQWGTRQQKVKRESADIFFALDISKSMWAEDVRPSRIERAKQLIIQMSQEFKGERLGLIIFAADAYLALPLTLDYSAMDLLTRSANPSQAATQGTSLFNVIKKAEGFF